MTDIQPILDATPRHRSRRGLVVLLATLAVIVAAGAVWAYARTHPSDPLARTDPAGAKTCQNLRSWLDGDVKDDQTGKPADELLVAMSLARQAKYATTAGIRASAGTNIMDDPAAGPVKAAGGPAEFRVADLAQLRAACVTAGESMPAYVAS